LIRWSKLVLNQFKTIHDHIAKDSPAAARKQGSLILSAIDQLETFPISGRAGDVSETRELVVAGTPYIVYYRLEDGIVFLKAIRHAARQKPDRFKQ
jgi:toxin ParE1/3/4